MPIIFKSSNQKRRYSDDRNREIYLMPPVRLKLPEQLVTFIDEGCVVGKLVVEKIVDGDEAANKRDT
jgi:hypothetical protein